MGDNFFLDGDYTKKQIDAINKIKDKKADQKTDVKGNIDTLLDEMQKYQNGTKTTKGKSDLFKYIASVAGMDSFIKMVDADGDGKLTKAEVTKLANYDGNSALTSKDINKLINDIKNMKEAKVTKGNTTSTYELNSKGKLYRKTATTVNKDKGTTTVTDFREDGSKQTKTVTDTKTGAEQLKYTYNKKSKVLTKEDKTSGRTYTYKYYDDGTTKKSCVVKDKDGKTLSSSSYNKNGKIESKVNNVRHTTTEYKYDTNGVKTSKVYANDGTNGKKKTLKAEYTYNDKGKPDTCKTYIQSTTGTRVKHFTKYTYDENGKLKSADKWQGYDDKGEKIAHYEYEYENGKVVKRTNTITGTVKTYSYNEDTGKLANVVFTKKDGTKTSCTVNADGTYADAETEKYYYVYEYKDGIRTTAKKYNKSEYFNSDGSTNNDAKPVSTTTYEDGYKKQTTDKDGKVTATYKRTENKDGSSVEYKITKEFVYVYKYDKNGHKTVREKYNASDCTDGKPKDGAKAVETKEYYKG